MPVPNSGQRWSTIDEVVEAYEDAQARDGQADLAAFVPPAEHPEYLQILCELVRVDLEYGWKRGCPASLSSYGERFPSLFSDVRFAWDIEYEESRLRRQAQAKSVSDSPGVSAGESAAAARYVRGDGAAQPVLSTRTAYSAYCCGVSDHLQREELADPIRSPQSARSRVAAKLARAIAEMPEPGAEFLGFQLQAELGRGAFGRVYLARQGDLANRLVALKVSADVAGETRALAQLQHTNIVPIYSVHRAGPLQAVCMPYLGSTTLADVLGELRKHDTLPDSGAGLLSSHRRRQHVTSMPSTESRAPAAASGPTGPLPVDEGAAEEESGQTLAVQAERLCGLGYVQAVLWLATRLADGLGHAHERGILHLDLKPANVLFSDDGEPLLLDFNLAADTKHPTRGAAAMLGGTLPYMAPEHLEAFHHGNRSVDARSDLYALGVILYELLTKRLPFEVRRGPVEDVVPQMIADRSGAPPDVHHWNRQVTPAVESIVRRCLTADPKARYQSARELRDDLQRQLDDLPLKHAPEPSVRERFTKWTRRHPRLISSTSVLSLAALLFILIISYFVVRQREHGRLHASDSYHRVLDEVSRAIVLLWSPEADRAQITDGMSLCARVLDRYQVLKDPAWRSRPLVQLLSPRERSRLSREIGDVLVAYAQAATWEVETNASTEARSHRIRFAARLCDLADPCFGDGQAPRALELRRADLASLEGRAEEAEQHRRRAQGLPLRDVRDRFWFENDRLNVSNRSEVLRSLGDTTRLEPQNYATWLLLGNCYVRVGELDEAAFCYTTAIALQPELHWTYFNRGLVYLQLKKYPEAIADFDRVVVERPTLADGYLNRALARMEMQDFAGAIADLGLALEQAGAPTRILFIRAKAREAAGDRVGAQQDRAEGLRRRPTDPLSWVTRGLARLPTDPQGALADYDVALRADPRSRFALQNKASVLSEHLKRIEDAVRVLDLAIQYHPTSVESLAGRGVLLARLGRRAEALNDARAALALDDRATTLYQVAGIYALTSKQEPADRAEAVRLMSLALRKDPGWLKIVPFDRDLDPIRDRPEFRDVLHALTVLVQGGGAGATGSATRKN